MAPTSTRSSRRPWSSGPRPASSPRATSPSSWVWATSSGSPPAPTWCCPLIATAIIAVAFEPARRRAQGWADRLVYGHRATPYEALARLSTQLSLGAQRDDLFTGLASTVAEGVGAAEVTLWVGSGDELVAVASWPPRNGQNSELAAAPRDLASLEEGGRTHVRPILHQGALRGAVTLTKAPGEVLTAAEDRLLRDLAAQAGLVIDNVGSGPSYRTACTRSLCRPRSSGRRPSASWPLRTRRAAASSASPRRRPAAFGHAGRDPAGRVRRCRICRRCSSRRPSGRGAPPAQPGLVRTAGDGTGHPPRHPHPGGARGRPGFLAERSPVPVTLNVALGRRLAAGSRGNRLFRGERGVDERGKALRRLERGGDRDPQKRPTVGRGN